MTSSSTIWYAVWGSISRSGIRCRGTVTMPARVNRGTMLRSGSPVVLLLFHTAMGDFLSLSLGPPHDLVGEATAPQRGCHEPHRAVDMVEELQVAGAQVVQPRLTVRGQGEAVLGASAVAGEPHVAGAAVRLQRVALGLAEGHLLGGGDQLEQVPGADVAEQVVRLDEVVARVEVPVVLERDRRAAGLRVDAQGTGHPDEARQRGVEHLDVHPPDVAAYPLVEDL